MKPAPGLKIAITRLILTQGLQKRYGGETSYTPIHALKSKYTINLKETVSYSLNKAIVKMFYIFHSPEHNFDAWTTKIIGWPDLCHSKPLAKFKRNPKRNVACRLDTRKSLWMWTRTMTVHDP